MDGAVTRVAFAALALAGALSTARANPFQVDLALQATQCYGFNGQPEANNTICPGSDACCGIDAICVSNRLCKKLNDPPNKYIRGPCSKKPYDKDNCAVICQYDEGKQFPVVTQCENGSFCCDKDPDCCKNHGGTFLDERGNMDNQSASTYISWGTDRTASGYNTASPPPISLPSSRPASSAARSTTSLATNSTSTATKAAATTTTTTPGYLGPTPDWDPVGPSDGDGDDDRAKKLKIGLGVGVTGGVLVIAGILAVCLLRRRKTRDYSTSEISELDAQSVVKRSPPIPVDKELPDLPPPSRAPATPVMQAELDAKDNEVQRIELPA